MSETYADRALADAKKRREKKKADKTLRQEIEEIWNPKRKRTAKTATIGVRG